MSFRWNPSIPLWHPLLISHDRCFLPGPDGTFHTDFPQTSGLLQTFLYTRWFAHHLYCWGPSSLPIKTISVCACVNTREVILTWQTGCSTVFVKPGSPPPNTTWPTSKSWYQSSSTCLSSCSTPTTLTWVSQGRPWQRPEMSDCPTSQSSKYQCLLSFSGAKQNGTKLADVILPPWAKGDPREFIRVHREVRNKPIVAKDVSQWQWVNTGIVFHHGCRRWSVTTSQLTSMNGLTSFLATSNRVHQL